MSASTVQMVPINALRPAYSPRTGGENEAHIRMLAESEQELPPILVHRPTMRVIDGMHRLRAARLRHRQQIPVRFFDGTENEAFVLAVRSNTTHGLPLSVADRRRAALRILGSHPQWSDRAVAEVTGLSSKSVAALRPSLPGAAGVAEARTGRDGRVRPLNTAAARVQAGRLLQQNPKASLREIADRTGISPGTVRDVRRRLGRGEDPVPPQQRPADSARGDRRAPEDPALVLARLAADPALRYSDAGRAVLRLLNTYAVLDRRVDEVLAAVPLHSRPAVGRVARACAQLWADLADRLDDGPVH
ncbi:winged helix-turn-helix transcriptional regulator [Actinoplanes sp. NPDC049681]|uniref:winged helix-turn-helix transcriptional regulator n=1 Tax=Actinoplanes sp. NPDC049681 TaxID=3363905 RepID=UPI00378E403E